MTFARVTGCQEMDEHGPLYATPAGVSTETLRGRFVCNLAALTVVATGEYDAHTMPSEAEGTMVSERCRLIDLGIWLDEGYAVPDDPPDDVR